jgi:hypothetical protein
MKFAMDHSGNKIEANGDAPQKALCPYCKAVVNLRKRQRENLRGELTYFWRHENHVKPGCPARFSYSMHR